MATLSVSVPDTLRNKMNAHNEVNWSAVARNAFENKIREVEIIRKIAKKSKLTEKDAKEISDKINKAVAKKFRGMK